VDINDFMGLTRLIEKGMGRNILHPCFSFWGCLYFTNEEQRT